jgi:hypothetical protein
VKKLSAVSYQPSANKVRACGAFKKMFLKAAPQAQSHFRR